VSYQRRMEPYDSASDASDRSGALPDGIAWSLTGPTNFVKFFTRKRTLMGGVKGLLARIARPRDPRVVVPDGFEGVTGAWPEALVHPGSFL
jgi:hypothetical protein